MNMLRRGRCCVLFLVLLTSAGQAAAHAFLLETWPEDSTQWQTPPAQAVLRFNETVTPLRVELRDVRDIVFTDKTDWSVQGDTVRLRLPPALAPGVYRVVYRVTSADGHPVAGYIQFGIDLTPGQADITGAVDSQTRLLQTLSVLVRAGHYFTMLAGFGGGLFWALLLVGRGSDLAHPVSPTTADTLRRTLTRLVVLAGCSGVLLVGINGALLDGTGLAALLAARTWAVGAATSTALATTVVVLGMLLTLAGLLQPRENQILLVGGALLATLSLAVTGHATTASPAWLGVLLTLLHGLAATFWVGALWPLTVLLRHKVDSRTHQTHQIYQTVQRFSRLAILGVSGLLASGAGLSVLQSLTSTAAISQTGYGRLWLAKLLTVALLLGVAAYNRLVATAALRSHTRRACQCLRRNIVIEIALVTVVLALTASFSLTAPPRSLPELAVPQTEPLPFPHHRSIAP